MFFCFFLYKTFIFNMIRNCFVRWVKEKPSAWQFSSHTGGMIIMIEKRSLLRGADEFDVTNPIGQLVTDWIRADTDHLDVFLVGDFEEGHIAFFP